MYHNFFFFNYTATTEIYTLSLHDALPIYRCFPRALLERLDVGGTLSDGYAFQIEMVYRCRLLGSPVVEVPIDRKSTRLNSSHGYISYAVFCLKKKWCQPPGS